MITRLGLHGAPFSPYGGFSPKTEAAGAGKELVTRLGIYGGPGGLYGVFSPKNASGVPTPKGQVTRLGIYGGPVGLYGVFSPKDSGGVPTTKGQVTRLGIYGGPRGLYGFFSDKAIGVIEPSPEPILPTTSSSRGSGPTNGIQSIGYHKHHEADLLQTRRNRILREDEDIMAFIISFVTKGPE